MPAQPKPDTATPPTPEQAAPETQAQPNTAPPPNTAAPANPKPEKGFWDSAGDWVSENKGLSLSLLGGTLLAYMTDGFSWLTAGLILAVGALVGAMSDEHGVVNSAVKGTNKLVKEAGEELQPAIDGAKKTIDKAKEEAQKKTSELFNDGSKALAKAADATKPPPEKTEKFEPVSVPFGTAKGLRGFTVKANGEPLQEGEDPNLSGNIILQGMMNDKGFTATKYGVVSPDGTLLKDKDGKEQLFKIPEIYLAAVDDGKQGANIIIDDAARAKINPVLADAQKNLTMAAALAAADAAKKDAEEAARLYNNKELSIVRDEKDASGDRYVSLLLKTGLNDKPQAYSVDGLVFKDDKGQEQFKVLSVFDAAGNVVIGEQTKEKPIIPLAGVPYLASGIYAGNSIPSASGSEALGFPIAEKLHSEISYAVNGKYSNQVSGELAKKAVDDLQKVPVEQNLLSIPVKQKGVSVVGNF